MTFRLFLLLLTSVKQKVCNIFYILYWNLAILFPFIKKSNTKTSQPSRLTWKHLQQCYVFAIVYSFIALVTCKKSATTENWEQNVWSTRMTFLCASDLHKIFCKQRRKYFPVTKHLLAPN